MLGIVGDLGVVCFVACAQRYSVAVAAILRMSVEETKIQRISCKNSHFFGLSYRP